MICLLAGAAVILLAVLFINRDSAFFYHVEHSEHIGGIHYCPSYMSGRVFVAGFEWDGKASEISVVIPDTVKLSHSSRTLRITKLGGFFSRDVPSGFGPLLPMGGGGGQSSGFDLLEQIQEQYPTAPVRDLTVSLHLGACLSSIPTAAANALYREQSGAGAIWRVHYRVDCDADNETFYSKDGRLYTRADDAPVELLPYGED